MLSGPGLFSFLCALRVQGISEHSCSQEVIRTNMPPWYISILTPATFDLNAIQLKSSAQGTQRSSKFQCWTTPQREVLTLLAIHVPAGDVTAPLLDRNVLQITVAVFFCLGPFRIRTESYQENKNGFLSVMASLLLSAQQNYYISNFQWYSSFRYRKADIWQKWCCGCQYNY